MIDYYGLPDDFPVMASVSRGSSYEQVTFLEAALGETMLHEPTLWGTFEAGGFWVLFAIFFPAGTGIKVGASMSGALKNPRFFALIALVLILAIYVYLVRRRLETLVRRSGSSCLFVRDSGRESALA